MKTLTIICGSPGVGKSTYAKKLALETSATLLDIDTCTENLVKVGLQQSHKDTDDRDSDYFKSTYRPVIYQTLFAIAKENLLQTNVIIVGPFTKEIRDLDWLNSLKNEFKTEVTLHYLWCKPEVRYERIKNRGNLRDKYKLSNWQNSKAYYGNEKGPEFEHVFVDTN